MQEQEPNLETTDVARLMSELQTFVRTRAIILATAVGALREAVSVLARDKELQELAGEQDAANNYLSDLLARSEMARAKVGFSESEETDMRVLGAAPGSSQPRWHPKRWLSALYRLFFARQERFNQHVVDQFARLRQVYEIAQSHVAVTTRLLASTNILVRRVCERDRQLDLALAQIVDVLDQAAAQPRQGYQEPVLATLIEQIWQPYAEELRANRDLLTQLQVISKDVGRLAEQVQHQTETTSSHYRILHDQICDLEKRLENLTVEQRAIRERVTRPEPTTETMTNAKIPSAQAEHNSLLSPTFSFYEFEESLRGGESLIAEQQSYYVGWFRNSVAPVLDGGCGRGEFLDLLRAAAIPAYGVDTDEEMVAHCEAKGHRVLLASLLEHLDSLEDDSLGGIFLGQVVEHLLREELLRLPALAARKLRPGAAIVIETVNPMCLATFSGAFYADPTHIRPIHPKGLEFLLSSAGFVDHKIIFSAPVPESDKLQLLRESNPLDPAVKEIALQMNANIERLNALLYSYANYAIAARKKQS